MEYVHYDEFKKMDIRVGTVVSVEPVEGADKLLKFQLDFGMKEHASAGEEVLGGPHEVEKLIQIVSGIREFYPEYEKLVGKQLLYILNLEPRTIRGVVSNGMLLAVDGPDGNPVFLVPETTVQAGSKVR
jgi:methionyl-tRNA synthetase